MNNQKKKQEGKKIYKEFRHSKKSALSRFFGCPHSQIAAEFLIIIAAVLIIGVVLLAVFSSREQQIDSERAGIYASAQAEELSSIINSVYIAGDGASKTLFLPSSLRDNSDYGLKIYPASRAVVINYSVNGGQRIYSSSILTSNISGIINPVAGEILVRNVNGGVSVE